MATRLPASERTREGLATLVEGRLSTASPKDELVKGRSDRCGRTTLLDAPRPAGPEPPVRGARGACAEQEKHVARHGGGHRHTAPAGAAGELLRVAPNRLVRTTEMNAVGAYDDVGLDLAAVGKAHHSAAVASFDRDAASPEADVG
jgi:hypothetical protein